MRDDVTGDDGVPGRIRTFDNRIRSPVTHSVSDDTAQGSEAGSASDSTSDSSQVQNGPPTDPELAVVVAGGVVRSANPCTPSVVSAGRVCIPKAA